jgi:hypothetical protein
MGNLIARKASWSVLASALDDCCIVSGEDTERLPYHSLEEPRDDRTPEPKRFRKMSTEK